MVQYLTLTVLTPERTLLQVDRATKVRLRLADQAWLSVYHGHAPLLAETLSGPVQYETDVESGELHVGSGILSVADDAVEILTSGLVTSDAELGPEDEDHRFDRLARQLLSALTGQPDGEGA